MGDEGLRTEDYPRTENRNKTRTGQAWQKRSAKCKSVEIRNGERQKGAELERDEVE
jgi:hypothetical protein